MPFDIPISNTSGVDEKRQWNERLIAKKRAEEYGQQGLRTPVL